MRCGFAGVRRGGKRASSKLWNWANVRYQFRALTRVSTFLQFLRMLILLLLASRKRATSCVLSRDQHGRAFPIRSGRFFQLVCFFVRPDGPLVVVETATLFLFSSLPSASSDPLRPRPLIPHMSSKFSLPLITNYKMPPIQTIDF